jgi:hypothetical protein
MRHCCRAAIVTRQGGLREASGGGSSVRHELTGLGSCHSNRRVADAAFLVCKSFHAYQTHWCWHLLKHELLSIMGGLLRQAYGMSSGQRLGRIICMNRHGGGASCRSRRFKSVSPFSPALRSSFIIGCSDPLTEGKPSELQGDTPPGADSDRRISMADHAIRRDSRATDRGKAGRG